MKAWRGRYIGADTHTLLLLHQDKRFKSPVYSTILHFLIQVGG